MTPRLLWLQICWLLAVGATATLPAAAQTDLQTCRAAPSRPCLIQEALHVAQGGAEDCSVRLTIGRAQAKAGLKAEAVASFQRALQIVQSPGFEQIRGSLAAGVAFGQADAGLTEEATSTFALASEYAANSPRRAVEFEFIGRMQARTGDIAGAQASAKAAEDERAASMVLREIIDTHLKSGTTQQALETAQSITKSEIRADGLTAIVRSLANANELAEAQRIAAMIPDAQLGAAALAEIARAQRQAGKADLSTTNFTHALDAARSNPNDMLRAQLLGNIARAQVSAGLRTEAAQTLALAAAPVKAAATAQQRTALAILVYIAADLGYFEEALGLTQPLSDSPPIKSILLYKIAVAEAKHGMIKDALDLTDSIAAPQARALALGEIALVL